MTTVSWDELAMAVEFVSSTTDWEHCAWLCRSTGKIYWYSEFEDDEEEELPDDIWESEDYIEIPSRQDLNLGKRLVLRFAGEYLLDDYDRVEAIFRRRGAYGRFKVLLESRGLLDSWYQYEKEAQDRSLRNWCELEGLEIAEKG